MCPTLCDPIDYTVHGIFQARILEWVAFPSPGDLPNPGIEPRSPALQADSLPAEPQGEPSIHPSNLAPGEGVGALSLVLQQGGGLSREGLTAFSVSEQMDTVLTS